MNKQENYYKPIPVGNNLYISHKDACGMYDFPLAQTLHIWRDDMPNNACDMVKRGQSSGLVINYKDGESLANIDVPFSEIADFLSGHEPRLIHCTAGQTRSPTIAIVGKILRGVSISQAVGDVVEANWKLRGVACNLCLTPLQEILHWAHH